MLKRRKKKIMMSMRDPNNRDKVMKRLLMTISRSKFTRGKNSNSITAHNFSLASSNDSVAVLMAFA